MPNTQSQQQNPACPRCRSKFSIKKGRRQNRFRILQVFQCGECLHKFTAVAGKNKTYPPGVILETVSTYRRLRDSHRRSLLIRLLALVRDGIKIGNSYWFLRWFFLDHENKIGSGLSLRTIAAPSWNWS